MCPSFLFGIEGGIWYVIVLIPDHCLSIYYEVLIFTFLLKVLEYMETKIIFSLSYSIFINMKVCCVF